MNNDLISWAALIFEIQHGNHPKFYDGQHVADWQMSCIRNAPAVDAEPARHGKCDFCRRGKPIKAYTYLTDCGLQYGIAIEAIYCPKCGEKMDGGNA